MNKSQDAEEDLRKGIADKGQVDDGSQSVEGGVVGGNPSSLVDGRQHGTAVEVHSAPGRRLLEAVGVEELVPGPRREGRVVGAVGGVRREARVALLEAGVAEALAVPRRLLGGPGAVVVAVVVPRLLEALGDVLAGVLDELGDDLHEAEDGGQVGHGDGAVVGGVRGRGSQGAVGEVVEAGPGDEAVLELGDAVGRVGELGAGLFPAGAAALPLEKPGGGEGGPVGAEADGDGRVGGRDPAVRADLAVGVEDAVRLVRVEDLFDELAGALVAPGHEVKDLSVLGRGDAGLLGAVAPVLDAVAGAETLEVAEVVDVDLAGVADLRLGEPVDVLAAGAEEVVPEEQVGGELRVVPGVAANVVAPLVTVRVVGVDEVAVVPEAVPLALLHLALVELEEEVKVLLDVGLDARGGLGGRGPVVAEGLGPGEVLGLAVEDGRVVGVLGQVGEEGAVGGRLEAVEEDLVGAGDAVGVVEAGFVVLVRDLEGVELLGVGVLAEAVVVGAEVEGRRRGAVDPDGDLALVRGGVGDVDAGGVALPEVAQADSETSLGGAAEVGKTAGASATRDVHPALPGLGALLQGEAVGGQLGQAEVAPGRNPVEPGGDSLVPSRGVGQLGALELVVADRGAGISAEASDALHGLAEETSVDAGDPDVAVVLLLSLERDLEADAEAGDEVLLGLAVVDDGVHDTDGLGVVVQVEAQDEGEPVGMAALALHGVLAADGDESAGGVVLADSDLLDVALEVEVSDAGLALQLGLVLDSRLGVEDKLSVLADGLARGGLDLADDRVAGLGEGNGKLAGVDADGVRRVGHGQAAGLLPSRTGEASCRVGRRRGADGVFVEDGVGLGDRVAGPLDGPVGPYLPRAQGRPNVVPALYEGVRPSHLTVALSPPVLLSKRWALPDPKRPERATRPTMIRDILEMSEGRTNTETSLVVQR
ncbi:hypothetical protein Ct61P_04301 [Colletotrichum tofieldiae]|nr:hypothetical protein Ct61P_04301 [Colletotrichum tofieldiae]